MSWTEQKPKENKREANDLAGQTRKAMHSCAQGCGAELAQPVPEPFSLSAGA